MKRWTECALVFLAMHPVFWHIRRMRKFVSMAGVVVLLLATLIPSAARAQEEGDLRLVGGSSSNEGRVEVFHDGQWGTVCDDNWDQADADVVCRQLGLGAALEFPCCAAFGQGSGPIWMDGTNCSGNEERLVDCPFNGFGSHDCSHTEDAGVVCAGGTAAPTMSTTTLMLAALALIASGTVVLRRRKRAV